MIFVNIPYTPFFDKHKAKVQPVTKETCLKVNLLYHSVGDVSRVKN